MEGISGAAIEAMAHFKPVITTRVGGMPELIEHDITGIMIPPADVDALAEAIINLIKNPKKRKNIGINGRSSIEEKFDKEVITNQIIGMLNHTIKIHHQNLNSAQN